MQPSRRALPQSTSSVALLLSLLDISDESVEEYIDQLRCSSSFFGADTSQGLASPTRDASRVIFDALTQGRDFTDAELDALADHGDIRARQGMSLDELFGGWHLGTRMVVDKIINGGRQSGVDEGSLLDLSVSVLRMMEVAQSASARGYHRAEAEVTRLEQQHRTDLVRGALFGTLPPSALRLQLESYGLDCHRPMFTFRTRPGPSIPVAMLENAAGLGNRDHQRRGLVALVDGDLAGFTSRKLVPDDTQGVIGLGPAAMTSELAASFQKATRALNTALAFGLAAGVYSLSELGILPAVVNDAEIGDELVARYLTPIGTGDGAHVIINTVASFLEHEMRVDNTAKALTTHTNTVRYRLDRFDDLAQCRLRNPATTLEVWWAIKRAQLIRNRA